MKVRDVIKTMIESYDLDDTIAIMWWDARWVREEFGLNKRQASKVLERYEEGHNNEDAYGELDALASSFNRRSVRNGEMFPNQPKKKGEPA